MSKAKKKVKRDPLTTIDHMYVALANDARVIGTPWPRHTDGVFTGQHATIVLHPVGTSIVAYAKKARRK